MSVYAILGIIVALCGLVFMASRSGAAKERVKQAEAERKAIDIADEVQNDVGAMPPDKRREDLKRW